MPYLDGYADHSLLDSSVKHISHREYFYVNFRWGLSSCQTDINYFLFDKFTFTKLTARDIGGWNQKNLKRPSRFSDLETTKALMEVSDDGRFLYRTLK